MSELILDPDADADEAASLLPPFISLAPLARWASVGLLAIVVVAWIAVGVNLHELRLLSQATGGQRVELIAREAWSLTDTALFWVKTLLFTATAGTFLAWLYQARVNLRAMGVRRLRFSRQWTIASFLVPFVNAFRPYQVMREIWQASLPANLDAFNWRSLEVPPLLRAWWGTFVAWATLELMTLLLGFGGGLTLPKLQLAAALHVAANCLAALAAFLACFVVWRISEAQDEKHRIQLQG